MASKLRQPSLGWTDVKDRLADWDRTALLGLIHDLYAASKDDRAFLHTHFGLAGDLLAPDNRKIWRS